MTSPYRKVNYCKLAHRYSLAVSIVLIAPITICIVGLFFYFSYNSRWDSIKGYNDRILNWYEERGNFTESSFSFNYEDLNYTSFKGSNYFPISDSCDREGDPAEGCAYTSTEFFADSQVFSNATLFYTIRNEQQRIIVADIIPVSRTDSYSRSQLRCSSDDDCVYVCKRRNGIWKYKENKCYVTWILNNICYRVRKEDDEYIIDNSTSIDHLHPGCFYSNNWSPYVYESKQHTLNRVVVTVEIRSFLDPVISASKFTNGCSDSKLYESRPAYCFGDTDSLQKQYGRIALTIGSVLFLCEVILLVIVIYVYVYKNERVPPKIRLTASLEDIFIPYTVEELIERKSPHVDEVREWTASKRHLLE